MITDTKRQPRSLPFLFLTEMWERFGFYVVQGLLVLYMTQYFGYTDSESYSILGVFTALAYISPLAGGYLANRYLGYKMAIYGGGIFLILGYVLISLPYAKALLYPALATIIVGNGLFKPNISSLLGAQYAPDDPRRDAGFTIFYIGINIGVLIAGFSSGYIKEYFGWRASFALASVGLVIGLITFSFGLKHIKTTAVHTLTSTSFKLMIFALCIITIVALSFLLRVQALGDWLLPCVGVLLLLFLMVLIIKQPQEYRKSMIVLSILILSSVVFWMLFLQLFYSANLFVDRLVDKTVFGFPLTTTIFYASESVFIILLGPIFAWSWNTLGRNENNPSPILKFVAGIFFAGLGFLTLAMSTYFAGTNDLINPLWVFAAYLLITIGELLLSPIGLAAVTQLAPPNLIGVMMGTWFVATGFGGIFAGQIAQLSNVPQNVQALSEKLNIYHTAFLDYAYMGFGVAIFLLIVHMVLRKHLNS